MLPTLLIPITGGLLVVFARRRPAPCLVELLAAQTPAKPTKHAYPLLPTMSIEQNLALSTTLLGLTTVGYLGLPLLRVLSTSGFLYLNLDFIRAAYLEWQTERQIGIKVNDAVLATGLCATRQLGALSLFATLLFSSHKLQALAENALVHQLNATTLAPGADTEATEASIAVSQQQPTTTLPAAAQLASHATRHHASANRVSTDRVLWQRTIRQGAWPLLVLSILSTPLLGLKRSLALLLTNFGYDYRLTVPLSILRYRKVAQAQGIWLRDGQVFEQLHQVAIIVLDVDWDDQQIAVVQTGIGQRLILLRDYPDDEARNRLIAELQAAEQTIAYISDNVVAGEQAVAGALYIAIATAASTILPPSTQVILSDHQPAQLLELFSLSRALAANQKRGLYLALTPALFSLGGIYLGHFSVVTTLFVDFVGMTLGILNATGAQLSLSADQKGVHYDPTGTN